MAQPVGRSTGQHAQPPLRQCGQCEATDKKLSRCARCHITMYCGLECQKAHWPTHKQVCREPSPKPEAALDPVVVQRIVQATSMRSGQKDFAVDGIARELIRNGQYTSAFQIIKQHVSLNPIIIKFFEYAAAQMLKDVRCVSQVETLGREIIHDAKKLRQWVVEALTTNGHIKAACDKARATEFTEQGCLLEIVASALMIQKKYKEAKEIALTIPDPGRMADLLQMIPSDK